MTKTDLPTRGSTPHATTLLHELGQSLWLDNITRDLLDQGTLKRYIHELSVTGLTSNPTIFEQAIKNSTAYDRDIRGKLNEGSPRSRFSLNSRWRILFAPPIYFGRSMTRPTASMVGSHLRYRRCWRTTQPPPLLRRKIYLPGVPSEHLHQDPRHEGRTAGDRRGDLRRRPC